MSYRTPSACSICGDDEPHHVHDRGKRIENYFTVGRGQTDFEAARSWKRKFVASDQRAKDLEEATREFVHAQAVLTGDPVRAKRAGDRLVELGVIEESEPR